MSSFCVWLELTKLWWFMAPLPLRNCARPRKKAFTCLTTPDLESTLTALPTVRCPGASPLYFSFLGHDCPCPSNTCWPHSQVLIPCPNQDIQCVLCLVPMNSPLGPRAWAPRLWHPSTSSPRGRTVRSSHSPPRFKTQWAAAVGPSGR